MKGKLRYIGVLVGVLLVILIGIPFFINVNSFRPAIEQHLSSTLGRRVQIGNLSLSIFSGSLSAEHLSISDDPSFNQSPFLTGKSLKIGVELWPLVASRTSNVTHLIIEEPQSLRLPTAKWVSLGTPGIVPLRTFETCALEQRRIAATSLIVRM